MTYDCIVIGAGPAGCSAALTLRARDKRVLAAYAAPSALQKARRVDNYPGLPHANGGALQQAFLEQMREAGVTLIEGLATKVLPMGDVFTALIGGDIYSSRGVIIATGAPRQAPMPGEAECLGDGVSYCATCDGVFYRGKRVAVIGAWGEAVREANYLAGVVAETTYFSEKAHDLTGLSDKVVQQSGKPTAIKREESIVVVTDTGEFAFDGVFVLRPAVSLSALMSELTVKEGRVEVNAALRTNIPRVYAAGDIVGAPYQIAKSAGEGNRAALSLCEDLENL